MNMEQQGTGKSWVIGPMIAVALLWPVAMLNYLDRQMLASMKFSLTALFSMP